jgi:hypothetical protein
VGVLIVLATAMLVGTPSIAAAAGPAPLNPPTDLGESGATETSVTITWTPSTSPNVTGYEAFAGYPWFYTQSASVDASTTSATLGGLQCGTDDHFSVVAVDSSGDVSAADTANLATSPCQADIQVVSNTPSVTHAAIGQDVTFTIVATNNGPDTVGMLVNTESTLVGLAHPVDPIDTLTCQGVTNDGSACEYNFVQPGQTLTETMILQTQASSDGYANEVACAYAPWEQTVDPLSNNCAVATVKLDQETAGSGSPGTGNLGSGGVVVTGPSGSQPQPQPGTPPPVVSRPPLRVCVPYTFAYAERAAGRSQRRVRVRDIVALDGHCHGNRILIERANAVFSRTHAKAGIYVNVSSWRCRQVRVKGAWLGDCWQGPRALSWSETVMRTGEPAIGRSR